MITKQKCLWYFVGAEAFKSLEEAQKCDLKKLIPPELKISPMDETLITNWLLENKAAIVDVLTTTPNSRLKARKLHGGARKKKVKVAPLLPDVTP